MAYIDHVQCGSCGHGFQPEEIDTSDQAAKCPNCGAALSMIDFFGVSDAFSDPDEVSLDLDGLVAGAGSRPKWEDPDIDPVGDYGRPNERWGSASSGPTPPHASPRAAAGGPTTLPSRPGAAPEPGDEDAPRSVLDVLRAMKKKS